VRLPPYPRYKPSGVAWLGRVPEHWQPRRLKSAARCWVSNVDKVPADDELPVRLCNYTDVYYNERIKPDMGLMETTATADEIQRFGLNVGDVIITKDSEEWSDIAVPSLVAETADDLVCGYHLAISRPNADALVGEYLLRAFQSCAVNQQFQIAASGVTRYGLPKSAVGDAVLPFPPVDEQRAIADFLDRETARLDMLVGKKLELIEKLKEKRTAIISHTVTRGLNRNVKFKPSGIEWLGKIPQHWNIIKFGHLARLRSGENITSEELEDTGDFPVFGGNGIRGYSSRFTHDGTFVLIGRQGALCGNINYASGRFWASEHAVVVIPSRPVATTWLGELLRAMNLNQYSVSAAQPGLAVDTVSALPIPVPPEPEQREIADYLDNETAKLDRMTEKVEAAIEKLREYRTALITAAVTGKIDVRKAHI
jgi:type I restriction enzyme, S subunit